MILDEAATPEQYRSAMSAIHVGATIKITGVNRHPAADSLLIDHVDLVDKVIVDIGASDGSTSVDLVGRLPEFRSYVISDLFLQATARTSARQVFIYDPEGHCILVAGSRLIAWPSISRTVRTLYSPVLRLASRSTRQPLQLLLLNPSAKVLMATDHRVTFRVHDIFTPWEGPTPDVIKVANVLRRMYFSDSAIHHALRALLASLPEGGHLLIVDNPRIRGVAGRGGLYRRCDGRFTLVASTDEKAEVSDIVAQVRLDDQLNRTPSAH